MTTEMASGNNMDVLEELELILNEPNWYMMMEKLSVWARRGGPEKLVKFARALVEENKNLWARTVEYKVVQFNRGDYSRQTNTLNEFAESGWRLVSTFLFGEGSVSFVLEKSCGRTSHFAEMEQQQ